MIIREFGSITGNHHVFKGESNERETICRWYNVALMALFCLLFGDSEM